MLSPQEALMMQAAYDEQDRLQAQNTAGLLGAAGGGLMGVAGGQIPHALSNLMSGKAGSNAAAQTTQAALKNGLRSIKPGFRAAGGLVGALAGGLLGGGVAAAVKSESPAARLMGKLQAGGDIDEYDRVQLENELASIYSNPSKLGM